MESEQLIKGKAPLRAVITNNDKREKAAIFSLDAETKKLELFRYLRASRDVLEFKQRIASILSPIGISDFAHTCFSNINGIIDPFGSHDVGIVDRYAEEGFHHDDLTIRHLLASRTPIFRSVVDSYIKSAPFDTELFRRHQEGIKFLYGHGLLDVYNVPIFHEGYQALFSIYTRHIQPHDFQDIVNRNILAIHTLAKFVDEIGRQKFKSHFHNPKINPRIPVPTRPLQLLETLASKDLTLNEAAEVLNISISTANQHIAAAKKSLKAHTTHGLILAAQREGFILSNC